jgi:toxin YoeB
MLLVWAEQPWNDYVHLQATDPEIVKKINALIKDIIRDHFGGLGKPEPLSGDLQGFWSRRISDEHQLVYRLVGKNAEKRLEVAQCRYHYGRR